MRDDQKERLADLGETVMDAFLDAADPSMWAGAGQDPAAMDPKVRGARNWDIKNANQAGALAARVLDLRDRLQATKPAAEGEATPGDEAEQDIQKYEQKARELIASYGTKRGAA